MCFRKYIETVSELLNTKPGIVDKPQASKENISQALNFQALIRPNKAQLDQVSQVSRLEERLRKLEATIGSGALTLVRAKNCIFFELIILSMFEFVLYLFILIQSKVLTLRKPSYF